MQRHTVSLSEEELLSLLHLAFFRIPNQLSPFYDLQLNEVGLHHDPYYGLRLLGQKRMWDDAGEELTLEGRKLFIPVFAPQARVLLFRGASAAASLQEFYIYKRYVVHYSEDQTPTFRGPYGESDFIEHLRNVFPDRRPPVTANKLSFFEHEFAVLLMLAWMKQRGENLTYQHLLTMLQFRAESEGLLFPIVGRLDGNGQLPPLLYHDSVQQAVNNLLADGFISETSPGTLELPPPVFRLFLQLQTNREIFMLREEFDGDHFLAREVSILNGEQGYVLGRCGHHGQHEARVVFLEDLEWHMLFRIINEIGRPRDYFQQLTLEVTKRFHAFIRG